MSLISGRWKYIEPNAGAAVARNTNIELGNDRAPQLYDLHIDIGERRNVASEHPDKVRELAAELERLREAGRSR